MKVKLIDVAHDAGVSEATASLVMNGRPGVNKNTRKRVFESAERLGYKPHPIARNLATRKSNTVGLVVTDISNPFFGALTSFVNRFVKENAYSLILSVSDDDILKEDEILEDFIGKMVEGIIIIPALHSPRTDFSTYKRLDKLSIPYVFATSHYTGMDADFVMADLAQGAYLLTRHILQSGVREIRVLGVQRREAVPVSDRLSGIRKAMEEKGLPFRESILLPVEDATYEMGYWAVRDLLDREAPEAILAINDIMALGAYRAIREKGYRIPEDILVAGYDDLVFSQVAGVPLSTVRQDIEDISHLAVNRLFSRINRDAGNDILRQYVKTTLIIRDSTSRAE